MMKANYLNFRARTETEI